MLLQGNEKIKKVLVISNACFSDTDSNGRTLAKLFSNYGRENLAQFYVYGNPNWDVCGEYYQVSDGTALKSLIFDINGEKFPEKILSEKTHENPNIKRKPQKTPFKLIMREIVWACGKWKRNHLSEWLEKVNPKVIFLSLADNIFLIKLAIKIAKNYGIPIVVYSTENYYFKKYNYITKRASLFYKVFHTLLKCSYKKLDKYVQKGFFNTPLLTELYEKEFSYDCECVFSKSDIDFIDNSDITQSDKVIVSYLGNLGVGRHKALIEIAEALVKINPCYKLDVYGKIPDEKIKVSFEQSKGINYKGFVSYEDVVDIMHKSTLLVHAETDDAFYNEDLKYAFSTKIADSICCGTPLLIYANKNLAETDFILREDCAFVVFQKNKLEDTLKTAIEDASSRHLIINKAKIVADKYFKIK